MIKTILYKFSTFKSLYGQAGTVSFKLLNGQHQVTLQTHWEDNCEYYCQPETGFLFEDQKDKSEISNIEEGKYQTKINIPEYYNYNGIINGDLQHISANIDAKLYGNIDIDLSGDFQSQKIKSEICRIKANNLKINSALETQFGELSIKNNVTIKKLLISKVTNLYQENGECKIQAGYVQNIQQNTPILQKSQFLENIEQNNHFFISSQAKNFNIGTFSGRLKCNLNAQSFFIKSMSGLFYINQAKNLELGITNQYNQGFIKADNIKLNIYEKLNFNIFNYGNSIYEFNESYYSIYTECNKLEVRKINNPFGIL
ncbi:unnamed protein product [Paramecium pentaurelia]|uniref:Adhesin domain-containing protein n=1 Tax=Paramecium pentaurelia TaxID=43138 RepID=A0A8S1SH41_9CILI|nr:unnamed protein product [Paramecium pentaurelia]